eukprot:GAHX01001800.1.p1 GENE.GAHX01001800.1~~GAHX01001800.1.p1  ORF type:complete len:1098 (-),score=263.56 GAHX01001800.1:47-3304(-)
MLFEGSTTCYDFNNFAASSDKLYTPLHTSIANLENRISFGLLTKANFTLVTSELANFAKSSCFDRKMEEIRKYGNFEKYIHFSNPDLFFLFTEKNFMYILSIDKDRKFKVNKLLASKEKILDIIKYEEKPLIVKNNGVIQQIACSGSPIFKRTISDQLTHGITYTNIKVIKELNLSLLLTDFSKLIFISKQQMNKNKEHNNVDLDNINDIISIGVNNENKEDIKSLKGVLHFDSLYLKETNTLIVLIHSSDNTVSVYKYNHTNNTTNNEDNIYLENRISQIELEEGLENMSIIESYSIYYPSPCVLLTFKSHSVLLNLYFKEIVTFSECINFVQILPTSFLYPNGTYMIEMKQTKVKHSEFMSSGFLKSSIYNLNTKLPNCFIPCKSFSKFNLNPNTLSQTNKTDDFSNIQENSNRLLNCYSVGSEGFSLLNELSNKKNSFCWDYIEPPITYKSTEKEFYVSDLIETGYDAVYLVVTSIGLFFYDGYEEKWGSVYIEENKQGFTNTQIFDGLKHIKHLKENAIVIVTKIEEKHFLLVLNITQFINQQTNSKIGQASHSLKVIGNCILSKPPKYIYYDKYLVLNNDDKIIILDFIKTNHGKEMVKIVKRETIDLSTLNYNNENNKSIKGAKEVKIKNYNNGEIILFVLTDNNELFYITDTKHDSSKNNESNEVFDLEIKQKKRLSLISNNISNFTVYNLHKDDQLIGTAHKVHLVPYKEYYIFTEKLDGSVSIILPTSILHLKPSLQRNNEFKELVVINNKEENIKSLKMTKNTYKPGRPLKNNSFSRAYMPSCYNPFKSIKIINEIKEFNSNSSAHYVVTTVKEVPFMMEFIKAVLEMNYNLESDINDLENESDLVTLIKSYENYSFYLEKLFYIHFNHNENNDEIKIEDVAKFIKTHFGSVWYSVIVNLLRKHETKYTNDILQAFDTTLEKIIKKFEINKESENLSKLCPVVEQTFGLRDALMYTVNVLEGFNMVYEVDINKGNLIEQTVNYMFNLRIKICEEKTKIHVTGIDEEENYNRKEDYGEIENIDGIGNENENGNDYKAKDVIEYLDDQKSIGDYITEESKENDKDEDEVEDVELIEL